MTQLMTYWSITSQVLKEEAENLWLEVEVLVPEKNFFIIRGNNKEIVFKNNDFGGNSSLAKKIVDDKQLSSIILEREGYPLARTWYFSKSDMSSLDRSNFDEYYPLIIKPINESHGNGVMMNIVSFDELTQKLWTSFDKYEKMIVQKQVIGDECRIVVMFGKVELAFIRTPPTVIWNGRESIRSLIDQENKMNPLRGNWYHDPLSFILVDSELEEYIKKQQFHLDDILPVGKMLQVRWNSNMWTWWTAQEITHLLHPDIASMSSKISKKLGMDLLCLDIISTDFTKSLDQTKWVILEIGGNPGFWWDRELTSVNTGRLLLSKLFF